ncbi:MAG: hypothetical protein PHD58_01930 [Anaerolineales bacterium]|nr:hypothetical protein [Anaerolineales bacterium]
MNPESRLAALRRFEPVLRATRGERFFPMDVERYLRQCSLWVKRPGELPEALVSQGKLDLPTLTASRGETPGTVVYLKYIEPLDLVDLARYSLKQAVKSLTERGEDETFHPGRGRLARVGFGSRFLDALFSLTLLWRGRVPGDTATAAALAYQAAQQEEERYSYYGRVVQQGGWVVLQYWFFYPFNNWRSGFHGANDHEADWEMLAVYCSQEGDGLEPAEGAASFDPQRLRAEWVAYASHEFSGDDLRRYWDDPEVEKVGDHPVVYVGAGSHASYFQRGEYLSELELPILSPLVRLVDRLQAVWVNSLRQTGAKATSMAFNVFRIPFVDYARGDGRAIGPGSQAEWDACLVDETTPWISGFRGLWGLYAEDPVAGENAPAGPMYNRDGTVRRSWYDPLSWCGLDKVPPRSRSAQLLVAQMEAIRSEMQSLEAQIEEKSDCLARLGLETAALQGGPHLARLAAESSKALAALSSQVAGLKRQYTRERDKLAACQSYLEGLQCGEVFSLRGHIRRPHQPSLESEWRFNVFVEFLSAVSIGGLMIGVILLVLFARDYLLIGLASLVGALILFEATFRGRIVRLIHGLTVTMAVLAALVLIYEFFWQIVVAGVLLAGCFIIWENLKELRR